MDYSTSVFSLIVVVVVFNGFGLGLLVVFVVLGVVVIIV